MMTVRSSPAIKMAIAALSLGVSLFALNSSALAYDVNGPQTPGTDVTYSDLLFVSTGGSNGTLNISSGITADAQKGTSIGGWGGGTGTVNVSGTFNNSGGDFSVGGGTTGILNINAGGKVTTTNLLVVGADGGKGTVTVDGSKASLTASNGINIGVKSEGHLTVQNNGVVDVTNGAFLVGNNATGTLDITGAGKINVQNGFVGIGLGTGSGTVTVSGTNSALDISDSLVVGVGSAGTLDVENGATVTAGNYIRIAEGAGNGTVTVSGAGSSLTSQNAFIIGMGAGNATLTLSNGGEIGSTVYNQIQVGIGGGTGTLNIGSASGITAVAAGTIQSNAGVLLGTNGELLFNHSDTNLDFGSKISGTGKITKENGTTTSLTGDSSTFTGKTSVEAGTLQIGNGGSTGALGGNISIASGAILAANRGDALTIGGIISGAGEFQQIGGGETTLNGVNTYTGTTTVADGTLWIGDSSHSNAQIISATTVENGATLGGFGSILGAVTIESGATLSPGQGIGSVGTLTVDSVDLQAGSIFQVDAMPDGTADKLQVNGAATIDSGSTLDIQAGVGTWNNVTKYVLIDTGSGVTGQFGTVTTNMAFLDAYVDYSNSDQVRLDLVRNDISFGGLGGTYNQNHTGQGLNGLGYGNPVYDAVISMSREQALAAFDDLSGEIHASMMSAILSNRYARDAVNAHLLGKRGNFNSEIGTNRELWMSSWVHSGHLKGDGNAARLKNQGWGFLVGLDAVEYKQSVAGVAVGYEKIDLKSRNWRHSDADIDVIHAMLYGRSHIKGIDLRGGIGYSWLDSSTSRTTYTPTLDGINDADYHGGWLQIFAEASHDFKLQHNVVLSPYLNLAYQSLKMDDFSEHGTEARLEGNGKRNELFTMTLGTRATWQINAFSKLYADLGWQYNAGDRRPKAGLNFIGGDNFWVKGNEISRHSALLGFGGDIDLHAGRALQFGYQGAIGNQSIDHALKASFSAKF